MIFGLIEARRNEIRSQRLCSKPNRWVTRLAVLELIVLL
jgi:hypothetical protein